MIQNKTTTLKFHLNAGERLGFVKLLLSRLDHVSYLTSKGKHLEVSLGGNGWSVRKSVLEWLSNPEHVEIINVLSKRRQKKS
uniref:Uncharacterized protein n=1 Tax=viral metagenome TaxID=1070528 RepID=A0A6M3LDQ8_9ZZZZ